MPIRLTIMARAENHDRWGEPFPYLAAALYAQLTEAIQSMISKTEAIDNLIGKPDTTRNDSYPRPRNSSSAG
jgi:hypothetical protein